MTQIITALPQYNGNMQGASHFTARGLGEAVDISRFQTPAQPQRTPKSSSNYLSFLSSRGTNRWKCWALFHCYFSFSFSFLSAYYWKEKCQAERVVSQVGWYFLGRHI